MSSTTENSTASVMQKDGKWRRRWNNLVYSGIRQDVMEGNFYRLSIGRETREVRSKLLHKTKIVTFFVIHVISRQSVANWHERWW